MVASKPGGEVVNVDQVQNKPDPISKVINYSYETAMSPKIYTLRLGYKSIQFYGNARLGITIVPPIRIFGSVEEGSLT